MGCAMGTIRYIIFFFNFLLALAGLGILILGVIEARSENTTLDNILNGQVSKPAIAFAVVGGCIFLFAFFGCCGALRESHCMISTYAVLLLTLFLLQVAVAFLAYSYKNEAKDIVTNGLEDLFFKYKNSTDYKKSIDTLQEEVRCCGSNSTDQPWSTLHVDPIPASCYADKDQKEMFTEACIPKVMGLVEGSLTKIMQVAIIVGAVEVVGIIFSLCLANSIRRSELRGYA